MKIIGIEHIGIAVENFEESARFWRDILKLQHVGIEDVDNQGVSTDIYQTGTGKIELLLSKQPNSPIAKFIKKKGTGIHHLCLKVVNIDDAIRHLKKNKITLIGNEPMLGAENYKVIFIHPESTGGVLVEIAEKKLM